MDKAILIFDFDGTIADTYRHLCQISNEMCEEFKYKPIDFDKLDFMRTLSAKEVIKHLEVPILKVPAIVARGKKEFHKCMNELKPIEGLKEILIELKGQVHGIGILSSNSTDNVTKFLNNHDMLIFDFIHTTSKVWSKNVSLKKLIAEHKLNKDDVIYIGDETRDIDAAKRIGIKSVGVSWGYNTRELLAKSEPDFLLNDPKELISICN